MKYLKKSLETKRLLDKIKNIFGTEGKNHSGECD